MPPKFTPKAWMATLCNIREMRKLEVAPVDTMGCDQCQDDKLLPEVNIILAILTYNFRLSTVLFFNTKTYIF
jgi:hypothetical protein